MRNFSSISNSAVVTYYINFDEYSGTQVYPRTPLLSSVSGKEAQRLVVQRLAAAFETPFSQVYHAFEVCCIYGKGANTGLCPSEEAVIHDLCEFWKTFIIGNQDPRESNCAVFNYTNLTTGAVVTWIYVVL